MAIKHSKIDTGYLSTPLPIRECSGQLICHWRLLTKYENIMCVTLGIFSDFYFILSHFLRKSIFWKLSHMKEALAFKKGVRMALKGHFGSLEIMVRFTSSIGTKFGLTPTQNVHLSQKNRVVYQKISNWRTLGFIYIKNNN